MSVIYSDASDVTVLICNESSASFPTYKSRFWVLVVFCILGGITVSHELIAICTTNMMWQFAHKIMLWLLIYVLLWSFPFDFIILFHAFWKTNILGEGGWFFIFWSFKFNLFFVNCILFYFFHLIYSTNILCWLLSYLIRFNITVKTFFFRILISSPPMRISHGMCLLA